MTSLYKSTRSKKKTIRRYKASDFFEVGVAELKGRRPSMEDFHSVYLGFGNDPKSAFFGVYDGHNGSLCSRYVSEKLPEKLSGFLQEDRDIPKDQLMRSCYEDVDFEFLEIASRENPVVEDGCTAVSVLYWEKTFYVANTGDSRAIMKTASGLVEMSKDQKPDDERERARVEKNGGCVTGGRVQGSLGVPRAFGDIFYKDPDTFGPKYITVTPDVLTFSILESPEYLILACDGLWDVISNEEAIEFVDGLIADSKDVFDISEELAREAYERNSRDNITVVVILISFTFRRLLSKDSKKRTKYLDMYHTFTDTVRNPAISNIEIYENGDEIELDESSNYFSSKNNKSQSYYQKKKRLSPRSCTDTTTTNSSLESKEKFKKSKKIKKKDFMSPTKKTGKKKGTGNTATFQGSPSEVTRHATKKPTPTSTAEFRPQKLKLRSSSANARIPRLKRKEKSSSEASSVETTLLTLPLDCSHETSDSSRKSSGRKSSGRKSSGRKSSDRKGSDVSLEQHQEIETVEETPITPNEQSETTRKKKQKKPKPLNTSWTKKKKKQKNTEADLKRRKSNSDVDKAKRKV